MNLLQKFSAKLVSSSGNARAGAYRALRAVAGESVANKAKVAVRNVQSSLKSRNTSQADFGRLRAIGASGAPLKLHFGCSVRILKGWINIDMRYVNEKKYVSRTHVYPEQETLGTSDDLFIVDFTEGPLPLPDNSVDLIFHEDFLEHVTQRDAVLFLAETHRVLKPGGVHRVNTPELLGSMRRHSNFAKGYAGVYVGEWDQHIHLNVFTRQYLEEMARMVGYKEVIFNGKNKSAAPGMPKDFRPDESREEHEQILCDLIK
jgi:SAM-dependent methyltransferase